jgi:hypothetical protein
MGSYTSRIAWETLRSIDAATLTGSYQALSTPLAYPSYICKIVNNSNSLVKISINGTSDIDVAPANSFWLYDEGKNLPGIAPVLALPKGTQFYVKGSAGVGSIYLVSQYIIQAGN